MNLHYFNSLWVVVLQITNCRRGLSGCAALFFLGNGFDREREVAHRSLQHAEEHGKETFAGRKIRQRFDLVDANYTAFNHATLHFQCIVLFGEIAQNFCRSYCVFRTESDGRWTGQHFVQFRKFRSGGCAANERILQHLEFHAGFAKLFAEFGNLCNIQSAIVRHDGRCAFAQLRSQRVNRFLFRLNDFCVCQTVHLLLELHEPFTPLKRPP
ncbi:hypothetical protein DJ90_5574 [Paenibacillus macerans]|uniref:Uncharacterized protein n=1 Tax=Paenibacillus macerans TaxID=44252 RepID=A0A090XFV1_PAEMA|nr:hypothetical protein DJ90_5574 [Paenibacillus macerans]